MPFYCYFFGGSTIKLTNCALFKFLMMWFTCSGKAASTACLVYGMFCNGYPVMKDGQQVGIITTGYHSISLDKSLAFALVDLEHSKLGTELEVQIRKKTFPCVVVKKRFLNKH